MKTFSASIALAILCTGCMNAQDNRTSAAKEYIEPLITTASNGQVRLISFEKLNGVEQNAGGMNFYTLEYRMVVETSAQDWLSLKDMSVKERKPYDNGSTLAYFEGSVVECVPGRKIEIEGEVFMEKTDNGWRCTGPYRNGRYKVLNNPAPGKEYEKYIGMWSTGSVRMSIAKDAGVYKLTLLFEDGGIDYTVTPSDGKLFCNSDERGPMTVSYIDATGCIKGYMSREFCKRNAE